MRYNDAVDPRCQRHFAADRRAKHAPQGIVPPPIKAVIGESFSEIFWAIRSVLGSVLSRPIMRRLTSSRRSSRQPRM